MARTHNARTSRGCQEGRSAPHTVFPLAPLIIKHLPAIGRAIFQKTLRYCESQATSAIAIATAAITAVSVRKIVLPNDADVHPLCWNKASSSAVHPPSGPKARVKGGWH